MSYRTQYPPIEPFDTGYLTVGEGHEVYYEQSGNREGKPALFVHGGPGVPHPDAGSVQAPTLAQQQRQDGFGIDQFTPVDQAQGLGSGRRA